MREVEAKAKVSFLDLEKVFSFFDSTIGEPSIITKVDKYYTKKNSSDEFRIRRIDNKYVYTEKVKSMSGKFEDNIETEREITKDEAKQFDSDCKIFAIKEKRGYVWSSKYKGNQLTVELFDVMNLGFYLEIEVIMDNNATFEAKEEARNHILSLFKKLELEEKLEKRKYLDLLLGH